MGFLGCISFANQRFFINVFGAKFEDQSAVIYPLVRFVNALGTLLMSFCLDPKISPNFDQKESIIHSNDSGVVGQLLALEVLGHVSMLLFSLIL
jgi:hypothetical protein